MDLRRLGEMVREVRADRGYDEVAVASGAHVAEGKLRQFEAGGATISTAELARISTFLGVDLDRLIAGQWKPAARYRQIGAKSDFFWDDKIHLERALTVAWQTRELAAALGIKAVLGDLGSPRPVVGTPYLDGYSLAREVRAKLGLGSLDVIDLHEVLEESVGVPVVAVALRSSRIAAIAVKDTSGGDPGVAAVIVNTTAGRVQNRRSIQVDLAHELSHVLFDHTGEGVEAWIDRESDGRVNSDEDRHEQRARAFAAELVLPAAALRELLGQPRREADPAVAAEMVINVCDQMQTPPDLTAYHLKSHDFIVEPAREKAQAVAKARIAALPGRSQRETLLERLVQQGVTAGVITEARARALLGRSIWD